MSIFDEIATQYYEIDDDYSSEEYNAAKHEWKRKEFQYHRRRELNDQAYFLFMFSRLEDRIRQVSSALITQKQSSLYSWKQRAVWDILPNTAKEDMPFKNRLALLLEKGSKNYNLITNY